EKAVAATVEVTRQRLERSGSTLSVVLRCAHGRDAVRGCLGEALAAACDLVLVAGATVSKDRADIVPAGILAAGGELIHFGMPVEPGNMLLLARIGAVPVIGMPGCARSRRLNGLDWLLHRLLAGLAVTGQDIMAMGVGGLIRSPLDEEDGPDVAPAPPRPKVARIAAVVLAAGRSVRMGDANKLLLPVDGAPMVRQVAGAALASRCMQVMVVTGHEAERLEAALDGLPVSVTHNATFAEGMAASLRCGIKALPRDVDGALILLGDMPRIGPADIDRLIDVFDPDHPAIVVPERHGRRGNPVLWPRKYFAPILELRGDTGARGLLERFAAEVEAVQFDSEAIFADVDTPAALRELAAS
ncbi:MAG: NTP transferase domain-containing protein, partial [Rhodocyclaceae bacterium]